ncbi:MAG: glycosyltransferase [Chloroflexota bacterium]|nr:MAG: glycosyltransferase [Chloroflexota bacterium]
MNILFVTPAVPFPTTDGARLVVAQLARELSKRHSLYLATFAASEANDAELARYFAKRCLVPRTVVPKWRKWAASLFDELPLAVRACDSDALRAAIRELVAREKIDLVHLDTGLMAPYIKCVTPLPTLLAPHDCLTHALLQARARAPSALERTAARLQAPKMRRYEASAYARATRIVVVSEREKQLVQELDPTLCARVIANGVDTDYFAPRPELEKEFQIGFHGVMNYVPNQAAALYFARQVMPLVWDKLPQATFTIIGRDPSRAVRALGRDSRIRVTGTVADVRPHLAASSVMVVPMLDAGGIKSKMLEAMAMGKAVVASPEAADGIDARAGEDFVAARDAGEFARVCVNLLGDSTERVRFEKNARAWALQHTWTNTAREYEKLYCEAMTLETRKE